MVDAFEEFIRRWREFPAGTYSSDIAADTALDELDIALREYRQAIEEVLSDPGPFSLGPDRARLRSEIKRLGSTREGWSAEVEHLRASVEVARAGAELTGLIAGLRRQLLAELSRLTARSSGLDKLLNHREAMLLLRTAIEAESLTTSGAIILEHRYSERFDGIGSRILDSVATSTPGISPNCSLSTPTPSTRSPSSAPRSWSAKRRRIPRATPIPPCERPYSGWGDHRRGGAPQPTDGSPRASTNGHEIVPPSADPNTIFAEYDSKLGKVDREFAMPKPRNGMPRTLCNLPSINAAAAALDGCSPLSAAQLSGSTLR